MATIDVGTGAGGKKEVDANIPLIPFIDLLLCCVMFLLVTAVWNQLASHDVVQDVPGREAADAAPVEPIRLSLLVGHQGYVVWSTAGDRFEIPMRDGDYDADALETRLAIYRRHDPNRVDLVLTSEDGVAFEHIIRAMDLARGEGFEQLALGGS